jgi:hypothetical protein
MSPPGPHPVAEVAETIRLAVAPIFLLSGVAGFLNVCSGRLSRVIDRARTLEPRVLQARGDEHDRLIAEIRILNRRISVIRSAITLSVLSAVLICLVVVLLFAAELFNARLGTIVALLFIGSMIAVTAGFAAFIVETRLGSGVVHIRNEILEHTAEETD